MTAGFQNNKDQGNKVRVYLGFYSHVFSSINMRKSKAETLGVLPDSIWKSNFHKANYHMLGIWSSLFCSHKNHCLENQPESGQYFFTYGEGLLK